MFERQWQDLEHARKTIDRWQPGLEIFKVFASLEDNRVKFTLH